MCLGVLFGLFEPRRDVSFITNLDERLIIQDFINACDKTSAWSSIRSGHISEDLISEIGEALEYKHADFNLMIQLMGHMATDWNDWIKNRKAVQEKEDSDAAVIERWTSKYKWNRNANNVLLLAYMENLLTLANTLYDTHTDTKANSTLEKILFELEISLARTKIEDIESYKYYMTSDEYATQKIFEESMEYKLEICKRVVKIPLPSTYIQCKERWAKNKDYIESCEIKKKVISEHQAA